MQYLGLYAMASLLWLAYIGVWFVIAIVMAVWVYRDAEKKCKGNGLLWLIVVILTGIIGFIIYLILRRDMSCRRRR